jgi:hypothetical protein
MHTAHMITISAVFQYTCSPPLSIGLLRLPLGVMWITFVIPLALSPATRKTKYRQQLCDPTSEPPRCGPRDSALLINTGNGIGCSGSFGPQFATGIVGIRSTGFSSPSGSFPVPLVDRAALFSVSVNQRPFPVQKSGLTSIGS